MKKCSRCKIEKPANEFLVDRRRGTPASTCKSCGVIRAREYRASNPEFEKQRYQREKAATRERHLVRKYGVDLKKYAEMLAAQNGLCAICHAPESDQFKGVFHVDHCHASGIVRGLLCRGCNHMLGVVADRRDLLLRAIAYLDAEPPQVAAEFIRAYSQAQSECVRIAA